MKKRDESEVKAILQRLEQKAQMPLWDMEQVEDISLSLRVDESVAPAMFRPDPLIPGGHVANSLTLRAMRPTLFVAGSSLEELMQEHMCSCGQTWDAQFWKFCPYCARP